MSDDRFTREPDDEANANDERAPYIDRGRPPSVRPAGFQKTEFKSPDYLSSRRVGAEEILAWIQEYEEKTRPRGKR
jgi:hypothetical protein